MLEIFGVDRQVESVYLALVGHPAAGVQDIAILLGVSEEQVHEGLDELARLSLVGPRWDTQGTIDLISPEVALGYLVAREQARLMQRQHQVESSRAAISQLIADLSMERNASPAKVDLTQVFGIEAVRAKIAELAYGTKRQVLSMMPDGPQTEENLQASRPLDEMLLRRGVQMFTVYLDSVRNDPLNREYIRWQTELGGEIRTTAVLPLRLLVFDRTFAVVPLHPAHSETGAAVVEGSGPVTAMCALFDQVWGAAEPFGKARDPHSDLLLSGQELAVVRLLAQGGTDATISRRLGVSPRTAGRMVSELMARLGAKSRFHAGLRVGELGLLQQHPPQRENLGEPPSTLLAGHVLLANVQATRLVVHSL